MNIKKKIVVKREIKSKKVRERSAVTITPPKPIKAKKITVIVEQPEPVKEEVKKPNKKKQVKAIEPVIKNTELVENPEIIENNEQNIE